MHGTTATREPVSGLSAQKTHCVVFTTEKTQKGKANTLLSYAVLN
jgi:hypothetical protein